MSRAAHVGYVAALICHHECQNEQQQVLRDAHAAQTSSVYRVFEDQQIESLWQKFA